MEAANGSIGTETNAIEISVNTLAARSATGIFVQEANGVTVDNVDPVAVEQVNFNVVATTPVQDALPLEDLTTTTDGSIKLQAVLGNITINPGPLGNPGIQANGSGNVLLQTLANDGDIIVNGNIASGTGHVTLQAKDDIDLNANINTAGAGTVYLRSDNATADAISGIEMDPASVITTTAGNVRLEANNPDPINRGNILLATITTAANVSLVAAGSITDNNAGLNVTAVQLRMEAANGSIGTETNAIEISVNTLAARSATGIFVQEANGVTVDNVDPVAVEQVNFNVVATTPVQDALPLEDLTTTTDGSIKLQAVLGNITINPGPLGNPGIQANGIGNVLLQTLSNDGDIIVNGNIASGTGHVTLQAGDDFSLTGTASVTTGGSGTVYLLAANQTNEASPIQNGVLMAPASTIVTGGGNVRVDAQNGSDIRLGLINAGNGNVALTAARDILDNNPSKPDTQFNVIANQLRMVATTGRIGTAPVGGPAAVNPDAIDTQVATLAATSALGIYVREDDGLNVVALPAVANFVQEVRFNSTQADVSAPLVDGLTVTGGGPIKLQSATGNLTIDRTVEVIGNVDVVPLPVVDGILDGNILLETQGATGDIIVNATVRAESGHISLKSSDDIALTGTATVTTGGNGTVYLSAANQTNEASLNGVVMSSASTIVTGGGNVRVDAQNGSDIRLGLINAGNGNVALTAARDILDNNPSKPDTQFNVIANQLRMVATTGRIGTASVSGPAAVNPDAIDTQVATLAARSALGIDVREDNGLTVGLLPEVTNFVQEVLFNSTQAVVSAPLVDGLTVTGGGPIKLQSATGNLTIDRTVEVIGNVDVVPLPVVDGILDGNILLETQGATGDIIVNATVRAESGHISLVATGWIDEGSKIAKVEGNELTIKAGQYAHLSNTYVNKLEAEVGSNGKLNSLAGSDWQNVNHNAALRGVDFLQNLKQRLKDTYASLSSLRIDELVAEYRLEYETRYANQYSLFLVNQKELSVKSVVAGTSANPNVYIETDGASNLTILGAVTTRSSVADDGGIVLVAGGKFTLDPTTGKLETSLETLANDRPDQVVYNIPVTILPPPTPPPATAYVNVQKFLNGGEEDSGNFSTREVLNAYGSTPIFGLETPTRHYYQQVALIFGYTRPKGPGDAESSESGFVTFIGYADGKALPFDVNDKPPGADVFVRSPEKFGGDVEKALFDAEFLLANQVLPTNAIVRRANDFFIFENASKATEEQGVFVFAENASNEIRDLTYQYDFIDKVVSGGNGVGGVVPPNILPPPSPILVGFSLPTVITPIVFQPEQVEFEITVDKSKSVAIYFVDYDDKNLDGQPDLDELPTPERIRENLNKDTGVPPTDIYGQDGGSPTPQDIEKQKTEFLADPTKPSGFYAIVEKPADGNPVVLEVFPLRDSPPKTEVNKTEPPIVPIDPDSAKPDDIPLPVPMNDAEKNDAAKNDTTFIPVPYDVRDNLVLSDRQPNQTASSSSRFAMGGLLFGSLWMVRESSRSSQSSSESVAESIEELGTVGFSSRDRRNRKLRSKLGE